MALLSRKKADADEAVKTAPASDKPAKAPKAKKAPAPETEAAADVAPKADATGASYRILKTPYVSEKAAVLSTHNVYVFSVPVTSGKVEIAKAVKALYGVDVVAVRTVRTIGKPVTRGRFSGRRNALKKAYVSVKPGQKIDLYERV